MLKDQKAEPSLGLKGIHSQLGFLEGDVLTILDAAYHNPTQNKAVKDLVKQKFRSYREYMERLATGDVGCSMIEHGGQMRLRRGNHICIPVDEAKKAETAAFIASDEAGHQR